MTRPPHHSTADRRGGTLERALLDPDRPLHHLPGIARHVGHALVAVAPFAAALALAAVLVGILTRRLRRHLVARGARLVRIGVPPEVQQDGGLLLWSALHDLLRPRLMRLLAGQPHLCWEISAGEDGTSFHLWVPRVIPPGLIERAVCAAWPGASATITEQAAPEPPQSRTVRASSELTLSGPGWYPLASDLRPDPLPLILGQLAGLTGAEGALVQVIARPATARERQRLRAAARRIRRGQPTSALARAAQLLRTEPATPPRLDPTVSPDVREVMSKSSQQLYRCLIRVSVTASSRQAARGRIHAILGAFAPYHGTRVWLRRRRVRHARGEPARAAPDPPSVPAWCRGARGARAPAHR